MDGHKGRKEYNVNTKHMDLYAKLGITTKTRGFIYVPISAQGFAFTMVCHNLIDD